MRVGKGPTLFYDQVSNRLMLSEGGGRTPTGLGFPVKKHSTCRAPYLPRRPPGKLFSAYPEVIEPLRLGTARFTIVAPSPGLRVSLFGKIPQGIRMKFPSKVGAGRRKSTGALQRLPGLKKAAHRCAQAFCPRARWNYKSLL